MPRVARQAPGDVVYHVLNRGVGRMTLFEDEGDYAAFERVLALAQWRTDMRLLAWCLMPNHWHLVVWPRGDGDLGRFMQRLTITHVRRWQEHRHCVGRGHVYQGRFKSFPCQDDRHLLTVLRYVERNALRAGLVKQAQAWRWGSLGQRNGTGQPGHARPAAARRGGAGVGGGLGPGAAPGPERPALTPPPVDLPANWTAWVNRPQRQAELEAVRLAVARGRPLGGEAWVRKMTARLGLASAFRPRGRPRKEDP